jgi:hypothetical protein
MASTVVHGGIDPSFSTQVQYSSQMSGYALTNHSHTQYLTTAAQSNHSHTNYVNTSETGNLYFGGANGIVFGSSVSGMSTTITASVNSVIVPAGNNYFINTNGHTFSSSINGVSTFNWIVTA